MTSKKDDPSWGYMLDQGATTSWESWSGGSHIHDTLISIGSWFIQGIGGIRVDEKAPGFRHFLIQPGLVGDLAFARARYQSIRGEIQSEWRIENGTLRLAVTVPPGTRATVYVPADGPAQVLSQSAPAKAAGTQNGRMIFEVESGRYLFEARLPAARP
jgi:alpha-L-rhamnosidase